MKRKKPFSTRNELGISQKELGIYLKVSRSLVELSEDGQRLLPTKAMLKHSQLGRAMLQMPSCPKLEAFKSQQLVGLAANLQLRSQHCKNRAVLLKNRLQDMQAICQQATNAILMINNLRENIIPNDPHIKHTQHETSWLKAQENLAFIKLEKYGIKAQSKLMLQIKLLEFEAVAVLECMPSEP